MSHLKYYSYAGVGVNNKEKFRYSQAVRIADRIECAGQGKFPYKPHTREAQRAWLTTRTHPGGWIPETGEFYKEINAQIDQAFKNVELNLKDAGGKGWSQVYRITSYHVPINDEALAAMVRNFKQYMPDHQPIWTCVGVPRLGEDDMRVEIEVVAHDPEGAKS